VVKPVGKPNVNVNDNVNGNENRRSRSRKVKFADYAGQRTYDFDELERQLLLLDKEAKDGG